MKPGEVPVRRGGELLLLLLADRPDPVKRLGLSRQRRRHVRLSVPLRCHVETPNSLPIARSEWSAAKAASAGLWEQSLQTWGIHHR